MVFIFFFVFFFFQAEDGIRDYKVTGVQTCALPISDGVRYGRDYGRARARSARSGILPEIQSARARRRPAARGRRTLGRKARNGLRRAYRRQAGEHRAVQRALAGRSNRKNDRVSRAKGIRARRDHLPAKGLGHLPPALLGDTYPGRLLRQRRRSEEHTSELQSPCNLVCRLLLEKKK